MPGSSKKRSETQRSGCTQGLIYHFDKKKGGGDWALRDDRSYGSD